MVRFSQPYRPAQTPNWRNEKSIKKRADESESYAINIELIVMKIVLLDYKSID